MSKELANELLEAGVHFGHQTRKWNPKMKRFIYGAKNGIYIIDLSKTIIQLENACKFVTKVSKSKGKVLFVGTKPQAQEIVKEAAISVGMPYVTSRWLGGLLTNFDTLRKSVQRYLSLVEMKTDGTWEKISKKEAAMISKEIVKLEKNLSGVTQLTQLPAAVFVVDAKRENIAIKEAVRLKIPVIAITDTDADPDLIQYPIPGNDDAIRSIKLITKRIADAILEGRSGQTAEAPAKQHAEPVAQRA